ncbi:uncharacterized protein LOC125178431 [Hyalella azteca]|uniref:Uncharacterized protein LOC125178431 n=1 Tax=Hyalella azteca TaxID=294128 RepID=A0A979FM30_HYAAZ|nr:uncharacterized protein LOC125178431 [Hyalella azteca]
MKDCLLCRRFNARTVKINQNAYRESRVNPTPVPFRNIFMDHLGPYYVKLNGVKTKVWILCISCMWSRAINLKICNDLSVTEFLRAFQLYCFEFGLPQHCVSDLGSQLVAGSNIILDFLKDSAVRSYLADNGIAKLTYEQFYKGCSKLGSLVESCVKMTKRLIFGSMRNLILNYRDFEFIVCQTVHLVNRRPIAYKEALCDSSSSNVPQPITPEKLIRGHDLISVLIIPELYKADEDDPSWEPSYTPSDLRASDKKLSKVRSRLIEIYQSEFLANLAIQATDKSDRYKPVNHHTLKPGDVVLLKEPYTKAMHFPMGIVEEVTVNSCGEITGAKIRKGSNREIVKRHVTTIIPLLSLDQEESSDVKDAQPAEISSTIKVRRLAAIDSEAKTRQILAG